MDKKLMFAWLQAQAQKQQVTPTTLYSKRLGINLNEYVMKGSITHDEQGNALSPERSARRAKRIQQIIDMGKNTPSIFRDDIDRVAASLRAKNVVDTANKNDTYASQRAHIAATLGKEPEGSFRGRHEDDTTLEVDPHYDSQHSIDRPERADEYQKRESLRIRKGIEEYKAKLAAERAAPKPVPPPTSTQTGQNTFKVH